MSLKTTACHCISELQCVNAFKLVRLFLYSLIGYEHHIIVVSIRAVHTDRKNPK